MINSFTNDMGSGLVVFFLFVGLAYFILWVYCLIDVLRSDFKDPNMKLIWVLILLFVHIMGPLAYLFLGKNSKTTS
jgi:hypothetical protein